MDKTRLFHIAKTQKTIIQKKTPNGCGFPNVSSAIDGSHISSVKLIHTLKTNMITKHVGIM
jgi:hypothetical protein